MPVRSSQAEWQGSLREGHGTMKIGRDPASRPYSFVSRFENGEGSNPEELLAAAHAGCFSMAFAAELTRAGHPPKRVHTVARVRIEPGTAGFGIAGIELETEASVPTIDDAGFQKAAETAKANCPVSRALQAVPVTMTARRV